MIEEFLMGQHPVATFLVAVALASFIVWCLIRWSERPKETVIKRTDNLNAARKLTRSGRGTAAVKKKKRRKSS